MKFSLPFLLIVVVTAFYSCKDDDEKSPVVSISGLSPESGVYGDEITITGENFKKSGNVVKFNNITASIVTENQDEIVTRVPKEATSGKVTVDSKSLATSQNDFTVLTPSITNLSTWTGSEGLSVTIEGTNFGKAPEFNIVKFNEKEATIIEAGSDQLEVLVPEDATTGTIEIKVGSQTATSAQAFTICNDSELIITKIDFTSILPGTANFTFEVTNVGLEDLDLSKMVLQTYVSTDNVDGGSDEAAGGTFLASEADAHRMLSQGETYIGTWSSNRPGANYAYLIANFYSSSEAVNECNTDDNRVIIRIE